MLQRLLSGGLQSTQAADSTAQTGTVERRGPPQGPPPGGPPPGPPPGGASSQFSSDTLSALMQVQTAPPSASDIASSLIGDADTDGDGALSLAEISASIGQADDAQSTDKAADEDGLSSAFAKLDTDGDGSLNADELKSAIDAFMAAHKPGRAWSSETADASAGASQTATVTASADLTV